MNNMDFKGSALGPSKVSRKKKKKVDKYHMNIGSSNTAWLDEIMRQTREKKQQKKGKVFLEPLPPLKCVSRDYLVSDIKRTTTEISDWYVRSMIDEIPAKPESKSLTPPPDVCQEPTSPNNKLETDDKSRIATDPELQNLSSSENISYGKKQEMNHKDLSDSARQMDLQLDIEDLGGEDELNAEEAESKKKSLTLPPDVRPGSPPNNKLGTDDEYLPVSDCTLASHPERQEDLAGDDVLNGEGTEPEHGVMHKEDPAPLMNRSSVSPILSEFFDASGSHDVATSPALKSLENSEEFSDLLKKHEEEEECHLMAESEERLKTLRQSLLAKRKEEEDRLKVESEEKLDKLRETLKTDQKRQEETIRMEERHLKAEHEEKLRTLRHSLLTKRRKEEERLRNESVKHLEKFQETLQTDLENEEENIRKEEERRLKAEHEEALKTLRQSLLAKRRESEKKSEQLHATLKADLEKQEEKIRKEHKVRSRQKLKQLETQLEEEFAAEKESLQKNKDEQLNSYKQEIKEERKALMEAKRDELLHQMNDELQKVCQEMEQNHQKEIVELREQHQSEVALLKEDLLSRLKKEKKQLLVSHTLELQKMNDQHQAEIEKRQKENSEQESELQRCVDEVKLRITNLNREEVVLKASEEDLDSRRRDLKIRESETDKVKSLIRERDMYKDELERKREEKEQLYNKIRAYKKKRNLQEAQLREERDIARQDHDIAREDLRKCQEQRVAMETKLKLQKERYDSLNVRVSQLEEKSKDSRPVGQFSCPAVDMRPSSSSANRQFNVSLSLRPTTVESGYRTHTTSTNGWHESPLGNTNVHLPTPPIRRPLLQLHLDHGDEIQVVYY